MVRINHSTVRHPEEILGNLPQHWPLGCVQQLWNLRFSETPVRLQCRCNQGWCWWQLLSDLLLSLCLVWVYFSVSLVTVKSKKYAVYYLRKKKIYIYIYTPYIWMIYTVNMNHDNLFIFEWFLGWFSLSTVSGTELHPVLVVIVVQIVFMFELHSFLSTNSFRLGEIYQVACGFRRASQSANQLNSLSRQYHCSSGHECSVPRNYRVFCIC